LTWDRSRQEAKRERGEGVGELPIGWSAGSPWVPLVSSRTGVTRRGWWCGTGRVGDGLLSAVSCLTCCYLVLNCNQGQEIRLGRANNIMAPSRDCLTFLFVKFIFVPCCSVSYGSGTRVTRQRITHHQLGVDPIVLQFLSSAGACCR